MGLDWSVLDPESLHAALANNSSTNYCGLCDSWYHTSSKCPFNVRDGSSSSHYDQNIPRKNAMNDRGKSFYKGKEICNKFNWSFCNAKDKCSYLHVCKYCQKADHSIRACPFRGQ